MDKTTKILRIIIQLLTIVSILLSLGLCYVTVLKDSKPEISITKEITEDGAIFSGCAVITTTFPELGEQ